MLKHAGGTRVGSGFYWSGAKWTIVTVPKAGAVLPGTGEESYWRIPVVLLLVAAPLMGGLYVMFLPFIGFVMVLGFAGRRVASGLARAFAGIVATVSPAWLPGEAYFAGKRARKAASEKTSAATETAGPLEGLAEEIEARRKKEG